MEVYDVFGIDATTYAIEENLREVMNVNSANIASVHIKLLAHLMTQSGKPCALTFSGLNQAKSSKLKMAGFERTLDSFVGAAVMGHNDNLNGISEALLVGNRVTVGTGGPFETISHHKTIQPANEVTVINNQQPHDYNSDMQVSMTKHDEMFCLTDSMCNEAMVRLIPAEYQQHINKEKNKKKVKPKKQPPKEQQVPKKKKKEEVSVVVVAQEKEKQKETTTVVQKKKRKKRVIERKVSKKIKMLNGVDRSVGCFSVTGDNFDISEITVALSPVFVGELCASTFFVPSIM